MITLAEALAKVDEAIEDMMIRYEESVTRAFADPGEAAAMIRREREKKRVERVLLEAELRAWLELPPGSAPPVVPDRQVH